MNPISRHVCVPALLALLWAAPAAHATTVRPMNIVDLVNHSETIMAARVESVVDGFTANGMPYSEVTVHVIERFRGANSGRFTFRQFGLSAPRTMPNGKVYLGGRPEGWPTWNVGEVSLVFLSQKARVTGFQTTVGLGYGKLGMGNGVAVNAYDNVGLFSNVEVDRTKLSVEENRMFDAKNGPVNANTLRSFVRRLVNQNVAAGSSTDATH